MLKYTDSNMGKAVAKCIYHTFYTVAVGNARIDST